MYTRIHRHTTDTSVYEEIKFYVVGWGGMIVSFSADYLKSAEGAPTLDLPNEWMNYFITSFELHSYWAEKS